MSVRSFGQLATRSLAALFLFATMPAASAESLVYFGTYTHGNSTSEGIYVSTLSDAGVLSQPKLAARIDRPSFVALSPDGRYLYSVAEVDNYLGEKSGGVAAFKIRDDGTLRALNAKPSGGAGACYVSVTPDGQTVLVANYGGGSVASYAVGENGELSDAKSVIQHEGGSGVVPKRQSEPHAHCIVPSPDGRFAMVCDLGLDQVKVYRIEDSALLPTDLDLDTPPGGGPRHFAFAPDGTKAYANLELGNELVTMDYDAASGMLTITDVQSTWPADYTGTGGTAECLASADGTRVYVTNRGPDSIAVFDVTPAPPTRLEIEPAGGPTPRGFGLTPDGRYAIACHQDGGSIQLFAIEADGSLSPIGEQVALDRPVNARVLVRP